MNIPKHSAFVNLLCALGDRITSINANSVHLWKSTGSQICFTLLVIILFVILFYFSTFVKNIEETDCCCPQGNKCC